MPGGHFDRQYRSFIERLARHLVGSRLDPDEVIDSVCAELFGTRIVDGVRQSKFRTYTGRSTLRGWLRAVVANASVDLYRRRQAEVSLEDVSGAGNETPDAGCAEPHANEKLMLAKVVRERSGTVTAEVLDRALAALDDHETCFTIMSTVSSCARSRASSKCQSRRPNPTESSAESK
jgi:DNA-directed RNA polymerase specialized sigma24 family protein